MTRSIVKKRVAMVGISGRSGTYSKSILTDYRDSVEIVALLDSNPKRTEVFNEDNGLNIPCYVPEQFDRMMDETRPDLVMVSTTDATHHIYTVMALKHDVDVFCEKPMTTDETKLKQILNAERESKGRVVVPFVNRYTPVHTKIREMIMDGTIGRPTSVDFCEMLDTYHGASYFKRWNRYEEQSGSLLVTKACHHFDLVNWWLGQKPAQVFAYGALNFHHPDSEHNPEKVDGRRCSTCKKKCSYYKRHATSGGGSYDEHLISFNNPGRNELFGSVDGYFADRCIFDSDIDTWDTFCVTVRYEGGAMMSYSLNASAPYEGYHLAINGTRGRIETDAVKGKGMRLPFPDPPPQRIRYFPLFEGMQTIDLVFKGGGHGGGDPAQKKEIFLGRDENDRTCRLASVMEAAYSVLVGIAARTSIKTGEPVNISGLLEEQGEE